MNKSVIAFAFGAIIGAGAAWYVAKAKYEALANEEIESVKAAFDAEQKKREPEQTETVEEDIPVKIEHSDSIEKPASIKEYAEALKGFNYTACSKEVEDDVLAPESTQEGPYKIDNDEVGCVDDYEVIELTYYSNNVLCDDMDNRMTEQDIRDTVGRDFNEMFAEGADQLCVRNDERKCDYSILRVEEEYEGE